MSDHNWDTGSGDRQGAVLWCNGVTEPLSEGVIRFIAGVSAKRDEYYRKLAAERGRREACQMVIASLKSRVKELESYSHGMAVEHDRLTAILGQRDARIAELDSRLAAFTAANIVERVESKPNPFREYPQDRRRVGGIGG